MATTYLRIKIYSLSQTASQCHASMYHSMNTIKNHSNHQSLLRFYKSTCIRSSNKMAEVEAHYNVQTRPAEVPEAAATSESILPPRYRLTCRRKARGQILESPVPTSPSGNLFPSRWRFKDDRRNSFPRRVRRALDFNRTCAPPFPAGVKLHTPTSRLAPKRARHREDPCSLS